MLQMLWLLERVLGMFEINPMLAAPVRRPGEERVVSTVDPCLCRRVQIGLYSFDYLFWNCSWPTRWDCDGCGMLHDDEDPLPLGALLFLTDPFGFHYGNNESLNFVFWPE